MIIKIIRWFLSLALIFGIYTETGIWTTLFAVLTVFSFEVIFSHKFVS